MEKIIGRVLIKKLTPFELSQLCDSYDDGSLAALFESVLLPKDFKNFPDKYATSEELDSVKKIKQRS